MQAHTDIKKHLADLQRSLAEVDLATRPSSGLGMELLILKFLNIAIRMDRNENHARPHFHIDYGKVRHTATYAVDSGERLVGFLPSKYDRRISAWAERNKAKLMELWDSMRNDVNYEPVLIELKLDKP